MASIDQVEKRLAAVERTVVDGEYDLDKISEAVEAAERIDAIDARLDEMEERIASLEGVAESLEGYVGNIQSVHSNVEQQADMAVASVDRLEQRIVEIEQVMNTASAKYIEERFDELEAEIEALAEDDSNDDEFAGVTVGEETESGAVPTESSEPEPRPQSEPKSDAVKQFEEMANDQSRGNNSERADGSPASDRRTAETTHEKTDAEKKLEQIANRNSRSSETEDTSEKTTDKAKDWIKSLKTV
jgi:chromosome segregation ATPase